ncbi:hypothetical protein C0993_005544, partial [Termitomyces sp. T159_Od127]
AVERLVLILRALHRDCQKWETKRGPWLDTMLSRSPCFQNTCSRKSLASSRALLVVWQGMNMACLVRWQTTTRMALKPS